MEHDFDKDYWEQHWRTHDGGGPRGGSQPNPYLAAETGHLTPGTALDAGSGGGAEAIWLAQNGWQVTAVDISSEALAAAAERARSVGLDERVEWVEADLGTWEPDRRYDLVMTHYAHPSIPQLELYDRLARWVAPGGTLLIVGHLHTGHAGHHGDDDDDSPPAEASVTAARVTARLDDDQWVVATADERHRTVVGHPGPGATLHDVVVRATRRTALGVD
ncbi:hypothetical protein NSZ01_19990 [Nocardioides szechwanensis]|uniref:Methyltransferase domain-containing protein n=1 Tax=Nocardioides szechwanensis TaxID=1005944 RepID=A0A1H0HA52_9ACTN|nr:class I SAM-dependent methyltransferase [Nocardioides szechwanensis]GEP34231.1 hypothetical protein NSZ01_19990 [Nocardioides szechwanensis]SDO15940.1 Methyltransferase domain-containing protein [Nocardioides szechwanensis]